MAAQKAFRPKSSPLRISLIAIGTLLLLAFYNVSNPQHVGHNHLLNGADYVAYAVCHRLPGHSFEVFGRSLPLCARCSGIYLGIMLTLTTILLAGRQRYARFPKRRIMVVLGLLIALMATDGFNSLAHDVGLGELYSPHNTLRLMTGFGTGIAIAIIISATFAQTAWRNFHWQPSVAKMRELTLLILLATSLALILLSNQTGIIYVLSLVSAAGVLVILSMLYTTLVLIVSRRDGQATHLRHLILPYTIGLALAVGQIVAISTLRFNLTGTWAGF